MLRTRLQQLPGTGLGRRLGLIAGLLLLLAVQARVQAQCNRVGWVASISPDCGAKIFDLNNNAVLRVVAGGESLTFGQTIRFSAVAAMPPLGCPPDGATPVALTCVSDTLPCIANFGYAVSAQNAYRLSFQADVYDPLTQFCSWTFGDGSTATGAYVQHTFPQEGYYDVCLTVSDAYGCSSEKCKTLLVNDQNPNWCGYDVAVTAVGTKLFGKLNPVVSNPGAIKSVIWFDNKTNKILAETPQFTTTLPGEGTYYICAQYEIQQGNDPVCVTTRCQVITVSSSACVNPDMVNTYAICPSFFAPVCACNGVTYTNECEAMAAGVTKWWTGECGAPTPGSCGADLEAEVVAGNPVEGYLVRFRNLSGGNYSSVQLDFGDGTPIWEGNPADTVIEHLYAHGGIYRTNLSVWEANNCVSSVTRLVLTDAFSLSTENMPPGTDYVLPGDANGDRRANVYDLLNLGLGFSTSGAPRPFATTAWTPQFSPNWSEATTAGVNFKHLDCDGNGVVNEFDRNAIEQHYTPIDTGAAAPASDDAPKVWVKFSADTLVVSPSNPNPLLISADIVVGSAYKPVFNLYGLAFALKYPEYVNHDPEIYYSLNSFFGFPTDILMLPRDNYDRRQFDMGLSRKYGQAVSGYGSIAKISFTTDFIIIIDVIERSGNTLVPFTVPVLGLQAISPDGSLLELQGVVRDTLWLNLQEITATDAPELERQTLLFPNPASAEAWLSVGSHTIEQINIFDTMGRLVGSPAPTGRHTSRLNVQGWAKGLYLVQVQTDAGLVVTKRLFVQ